MPAIDPQHLSLQPMTAADIDAIMDIELRSYSHPWTPGIFNDCLRVGYSCWVWQHQNQTIGYLILSIAVEELHILNICIDPEYQRQGLGKQLLKQAEELGQTAGVKDVYLEVRPSNQAALMLYQDLGYNQIGIRKDYYPATHGREDAIVMGKSFI